MKKYNKDLYQSKLIILSFFFLTFSNTIFKISWATQKSSFTIANIYCLEKDADISKELSTAHW